MQNRNLINGVPHPYLEGYSVLPKLRKIDHGEIFQYEPEHFARCLQEKREATKHQTVEFEYRLSQQLRETVRDFILNEYPAPLAASDSLAVLAMQMQEDFIIHALEDGEDWMAYGHVCLPSGWNPAEKVGQSLRQLHAPIPGMKLENSRQLVEAMVHSGPFERFIWSVVHEDKLNFHPSLPKQKFDPVHPQLFIKVERQVTVGFPEANGALFLLRESLIPVEEINLQALKQAITDMNPAERIYKGLERCEAGLLPWLEGLIAGDDTGTYQ